MFKSMAKTTRVALVAGIVGLGAMAAAPAMAQGSSAFGLQFGFSSDDNESGNDDFFSLGGPELAMCLTNSQIRNAVAQRGYTNIYLNVPNNKHIEVKATKDGWVYLLDFNYCTNKIEGRNTLRAAQ